MSVLEMLTGRFPESWALQLADGAVRGFLVLAVAALVATVLRRRSAAVRHLVWTLGILAILIVPVLSWIVPMVRVPMPFGAKPGSGAVAWVGSDAPVIAVWPSRRATATIEVSPSAITSTVVVDAASVGASRVAGAGPVVTAVSPVVGTGPKTKSRARATVVHQAQTAPVARARSASATDGSSIVWLWLVGVLAGLFWLVVSHVRLAIVRRTARVLQAGRCVRIAEDIAWDLGISERVTLVLGGADAMPMTWGVFRPVVLLPATSLGWSRERLEMVLRHELAHVARRDAASQRIAEIACVLHWYNPLVWLAAARMRTEREHACDDLVLEGGSRASAYASELLDIARTLHTQRALRHAAIAMARRSQLKERLAAVLDEDRLRARPTRGLLAAAALCATGIVLPLAALEPAALQSPVPDTAVRPGIASGALPRATTPVIVAIAAPTPIASQVALCRRSEDGSASTNINNDSWRISWTGRNCRVDIAIDGEIEHDAFVTTITAIAAGGRVRLEDRIGDQIRRLDIRPLAGGLDYSWQLNGRTATFDADAREWMSGLLQELARTAGFGAEGRAAAILERDGPNGVLREIAELRSDRIRSRYYRGMLTSERIAVTTRADMLNQASMSIDSDRELASLLVAVAEQVESTPGLRRTVLESAASLQSDREKVRVLTSLIDHSTLDADELSAVLASARTVQSDRERNRLFAALASQSLTSRAVQMAWIETARTMSSDREKREALSRLFAAGSLPADVLSTAFDAARTIESDRELATLLITALETQRVSAAAGGAFTRAMDTIKSEREHGRVASAFLRAEGRAPMP